MPPDNGVQINGLRSTWQAQKLLEELKLDYKKAQNMLSEWSASRETVGSEGSPTGHILNLGSLAQGTGVTLRRFLRNSWKAFKAWKRLHTQ